MYLHRVTQAYIVGIAMRQQSNNIMIELCFFVNPDIWKLGHVCCLTYKKTIKIKLFVNFRYSLLPIDLFEDTRVYLQND